MTCQLEASGTSLNIYGQRNVAVIALLKECSLITGNVDLHLIQFDLKQNTLRVPLNQSMNPT